MRWPLRCSSPRRVSANIEELQSIILQQSKSFFSLLALLARTDGRVGAYQTGLEWPAGHLLQHSHSQLPLQTSAPRRIARPSDCRTTPCSAWPLPTYRTQQVPKLPSRCVMPRPADSIARQFAKSAYDVVRRKRNRSLLLPFWRSGATNKRPAPAQTSMLPLLNPETPWSIPGIPSRTVLGKTSRVIPSRQEVRR